MRLHHALAGAGPRVLFFNGSGATLEGYDMTTTAGAVVQPDFTTGLKAAPKTLGSAASNVGLGIAAFDARIRLLIPVTKDNGVYTATLTISVL